MHSSSSEKKRAGELMVGGCTERSSWCQWPGAPREGLCVFSPHHSWLLLPLTVWPDSLPVGAHARPTVSMPEPLTGSWVRSGASYPSRCLLVIDHSCLARVEKRGVCWEGAGDFPVHADCWHCLHLNQITWSSSCAWILKAVDSFLSWLHDTGGREVPASWSKVQRSIFEVWICGEGRDPRIVIQILV